MNNTPRCILLNLLKLIIGLAVIGIVYIWTDQTYTKARRRDNDHNSSGLSLIQKTDEFNRDESKIAKHFALDTLPGLMKCGLIKKYERRQSGNVLFVAGKLWQKRSRFFKESLLSEILIYSKVNGYTLETRIIDHSSHRLYAQAISENQKEFFD